MTGQPGPGDGPLRLGSGRDITSIPRVLAAASALYVEVGPELAAADRTLSPPGVWRIDRFDGSRAPLPAGVRIAWIAAGPPERIFTLDPDESGDDSLMALALRDASAALSWRVDRLERSAPPWLLREAPAAFLVRRRGAGGAATWTLVTDDGGRDLSAGLDVAQAALVRSEIVLLAQRAPGPEPAFGIYALDLDTASLREVVPPKNGTSTSLVPDGPFSVLGCDDAGAPCPVTGRPACAVLYERRFGTGDFHRTLLLWDEERPIGLPSADAPAFSFAVPGHALWGDGEHLDVADLCTGALRQCPLPDAGQPILYRTDDAGPVTLQTGGATTALWRVPLDAGCPERTRDGLGRVWRADAHHLLGATAASEGSVSLWRGALDGTDPVDWTPGPYPDVFPVPGGAIVGHASDGLRSLLFVDGGADRPRESLLSNAAGLDDPQNPWPFVAHDGWLLALRDFSPQDLSGTLVWTALPGASQVVDEGVTTYAATSATDCAYVVKTRVPSDRDGLWWSKRR